MRESGVLASRTQEASPLTDLAGPRSWKELLKAEDWKAKYIMEMSGSSHHPLCIKPVRKKNKRRKVSGLNGKVPLLSLSISPPTPRSLPPLCPPRSPRAEAFCRGARALPCLSPARGWGGRRGAAGAGPGLSGPALRGRREAAGPGRDCGAARSRPTSAPPARHRWGAAAGAAPPGCSGERERGGDGCCWRPCWGLFAAPRRGAAGGGGRPAWARCCGRWRRSWRTRSTSCATRCRRWGGGGRRERGDPPGVGGPFSPLTVPGPGRTSPHLREAPASRPPSSIPVSGRLSASPQRGRADACDEESRRPALPAPPGRWGAASSGRESGKILSAPRPPPPARPVLPPSSGGGGREVRGVPARPPVATEGLPSASGAVCSRWRALPPRFSLLAGPPGRPAAAARPCGSGVRRRPVPVLPPPCKATPVAAVRTGSEWGKTAGE